MVKFLTKVNLLLCLSILRQVKIALILFVSLGFVQISALAQQPNIYFEIVNDSLANGTHYHFDVNMYADQAGTYHNRGQVYVVYDTAAFGEAVVFNGKVSNCPTGNSSSPTCTTIHMALLNETDPFFFGPKYRTVMNDNGDRMVATWGSLFENVCPPNAATHTVVPVTSTGLYHFEIEMQNPLIDPKLDFYFALMDGEQFFANPNPLTPGDSCDLPYGNVSAPLAADLLYFEGKKSGAQEVHLFWESQQERNLGQYVIEKKQGENGAFKPIAWMIAQGNSTTNHEYDYLDTRPMNTVNYYRLRMVSLEGEETYSETIEIHFDALAERFSIYPIPAQDYLMIEPLVSMENEEMRYQIFNAQGQIITQGSFKEQSPLKVSTSALSSGIYYIRISGKNAASFQKQFAKR